MISPARILLLLAASLLADGGMSTCDDRDYVDDHIRTVSWKPRITRIERNGVAVDTGSFQRSQWGSRQPLSSLSQLRFKGASMTEMMSTAPSPDDPFQFVLITGAGFYTTLRRRP